MQTRIPTYDLKKTFYLPKGLQGDLQEMVYTYDKPTYSNYANYVYALSTVTFSATKYKDGYQKQGAAINTQVMNKILGHENKQRVFENLEDWGLLRMVQNYNTASGQSRTYKLAPELEGTGTTPVIIKARDSRIIKKLEQRRLEELSDDQLLRHQYDMLQHHITLSDTGLEAIKAKYRCPHMTAIVDAYHHPDVNVDAAISNVSVEDEDIILFTFLTRDFFVPTRPNPRSRIYTNLSCLKRCYRDYLLLDGVPIRQTDLINSQIVFSIPVIEKALKHSTSPDFLLYKELAQEGRMYEAIAEQAGVELNIENRKLFKQRFFGQIFFAKPSHRKTRIKTAFKSLFPTVTDAINTIKAADYRHFPVQLQEFEASVMLKVLRQMIKMGINVMSIHDSIVVNHTTDLELAESLICKELQAYKVTTRFKKG
jgi:hypothetical protein